MGNEAAIELTADGVIVGWSDGAERIYGYPAAGVVGRPVDRLEAEDRQGELRRLLEAGLPAMSHVPAVHRTRDGKLIDVAVTVTTRDAAAGAGVATRCVIRIRPPSSPSERHRDEELQAELAAIVESSENAVVGLTLDGRITSWNPAAARLWGRPAEDRLGEHILPERREQVDQLLAEVAAGRSTDPIEVTGHPRGGREVILSVTFRPVRDASGAVVGAASIARDVTEQRALDREREQALRNLEEAQRLARIGSWSWHPEEGETWSPQLFELYELDPAEGRSAPEKLLAQIRPEHHARVYASGAALEQGRDIEPFEVETITGRVLLTRARRAADTGGYLGTVQDVTEERAAEQERLRLLEATARAASANRAKSEFLARMSHELRTPLNAIIGFGQLLELEDLQPREREDVGFILRAGNHLLELINEVLDIAQIEAGRMSISPEPVPVRETVRSAVELVEPLAREREVDLHFEEAEAADGHVQAAVNRLTQVLLNLLSNAIKYNRRGGRVDVGVCAGGEERLRIAVRDTGPGISADKLGQLFEPFERLGAEQTEIEGTGLGLTLSRGLVEAMGGTIDVVSEPGAGSTFTVELSAAAAPDVRRAPATNGRGPDLVADGDRRRLVLYIEDNQSNTALVERLLEREPGIELLSAARGGRGIELARRRRPDLILLDLHLPDMGGLDVLRHLRAAYPTVPVIVVTANAIKGQAEIALEQGANDVLTKPLDANAFLEAVRVNLSAGDARTADV